MNTRFVALSAMLAVITAIPIRSVLFAAPPQDLPNKVVLANPSKYVVAIRLGGRERKIEPQKASVLSPKRYPATVEFWSGKPAVGWTKTEVTSAGVYDFRWQGEQWSLTRRASRTSNAAAKSAAQPRPSYSRSTGSYARTARRPTYLPRRPVYVPRRPVLSGGIVGLRWASWVRGVWGIAKLYQFVRDEEDRDLIREIIIGGEIDDAIEREIEDALRDELIAVPYGERREIEQAIDDVSRLNPDDWKGIATLPADQWDRFRDEIGDQISDADWKGIGGWVDTMDEPIDGNLDLQNAGIESMDENIDIGDLDSIDGNVDLDFGQQIDDIDLGDITADAGSMDLSDFDEGGYEGGLELGDLGLGDAGAEIGSIGDAGGGWDGGGFDFNSGGYDAGGFDNIGGGWGAGGFDDFGGGGFGGGGDFGGGDFGGGDFGGDFGGGDFGGGFDF